MNIDPTLIPQQSSRHQNRRHWLARLLRLRLPALPPVIYFGFRWVMRLVSLTILLVRHRREPSSLLAWVLTILFLPWLGLPLFLIFGSNRLPKAYQEQHQRLQRRFNIILDELREFEPKVGAVYPADLVPFARLVEKLGGLQVTAAESFDLEVEYDAAIEHMIHEIDRATDYIHVLFYIYADDDTGRRFTRALIRAASRGVTVRVLVDASGSRPFIGEMDDWMRESDIDYHVFLPLRPKMRRYVRMDLRNHRKLLIIDGHTAYTGSQNIVNSSYNTRGKLHWLDMMVKVTGPVVNQLQTVFIQDWYAETQEFLQQASLFPEHRKSAAIPIQVLPSGPNYDTLNYLHAAIAAIHLARKKVVITTPYLVPSESLLRALQSAILFGVDVTLIVPKHSDHNFVDIASHAYFRELLDMGVNIRLYKPCLLHAKSLTVDDRLAFVSTGNFDIRSFELNYELTVAIYDGEAVKRIADFQEGLLPSCERLTREIWGNRPLYKKIVQNSAKLLSPFL